MRLTDILEAFRKTGECPSCVTVIGIQCHHCSRFLFSSERYCPNCGTSVHTENKEESVGRSIVWSASEMEIFRLDAGSLLTQAEDSNHDRVLDQDAIDELFS